MTVPNEPQAQGKEQPVGALSITEPLLDLRKPILGTTPEVLTALRVDLDRARNDLLLGHVKDAEVLV